MGKINRTHNQFTSKGGKGLLPTPPTMLNNRQMGRAKPGSSSSDGDTGKSGWRTYAQAKNSEAFFKKKRQINNSSNSKGYRQNSGYQQRDQRERERTPKSEKSQSSDERGPSSSPNSTSPSTGGTTEDKEIEIIAHVRKNNDWNQQRQQREWSVVKTGPPFDPFHPIALAPPPSQQQVAKMYEEMLYSAAVENSPSSTAKGLRTAGDTVRFAEEHSSGYFVKTGSKFGNSVMPVLPRL